MNRLYLTVGLALAALGCAPLPLGETIYEVPHVRGTLTSDSAPVSGVEVWQVASDADNACEATRATAAVATTDADGVFSLPAVSRRKTWVLVGVMEYFSPHSLCFASSGTTKTFRHVFGSAGYRQVPAAVEATCELGRSERVGCEVRSAV